MQGLVNSYHFASYIEVKYFSLWSRIRIGEELIYAYVFCDNDPKQ